MAEESGRSEPNETTVFDENSLVERMERNAKKKARKVGFGSYSLVTADGEEIEATPVVTLTKTDKIHMGLLLILPGALAITPVLMPFGNPFRRDGDNSVGTNWAYYTFYNIIGWGAIWIKVTLWNCAIWKQNFFFPFMQHRSGLFEANKSLASWCTACTFSSCFFMAGYYLFLNPIPFGTISGGVPCYVFNFVCMYCFLVPANKKKTVTDHIKIIRCWLPFVMWVCCLILFLFLTYVNGKYVLKLHDDEKAVQYICGTVAIQITFIAIREAFCSLPIEMFMGVENKDVAFLWIVGYSAMYSTYTDWMFPGMPHSSLGIVAQGSIIAVNSLMSFLQFFMVRNSLSLCEVFLNTATDIVSGLAFLFIFTYNCYGPNKEYMYIIDVLTDEQVVQAAQFIAINLVLSCLRMAAMGSMAPKVHDKDNIAEAKYFMVQALRKWYWMLVWLLVSTCCACGACMVMKHDGMDTTLQFKDWYPTGINFPGLRSSP